MYHEWSLDVLYKGVKDPKLQADMQRLETVIAEHSAAVAALDAAKPVESLRRVMEVKEELTVLVRRLAGYFSLRRSANSADTEGAGYLTKVQAMAAATARDSVVFDKFAGSLEHLEELLEQDDLLKQYRFFFKEIQNAGGVDFSLPLMLGYTGISDALLQKYIQDSASLWEGNVEKMNSAIIGSVIGTHAGPGAIAVAFFKNK